MVAGGGSWQVSRAASSSLLAPTDGGTLPGSLGGAFCSLHSSVPATWPTGTVRGSGVPTESSWGAAHLVLALRLPGGSSHRGRHSDLSDPAVGPSQVRGTLESQIYRKPVPARIKRETF